VEFLNAGHQPRQTPPTNAGKSPSGGRQQSLIEYINKFQGNVLLCGFKNGRVIVQAQIVAQPDEMASRRFSHINV
jgi:hypothetical protein